MRLGRRRGDAPLGFLFVVALAALASLACRAHVGDEASARLGTFTPREVLKIDGDALKVDEVLVLPDGAAKAIAGDGSVYLAPRDVPPFSLPATVSGDVARGRRTAFMLFAAGEGPFSHP